MDEFIKGLTLSQLNAVLELVNKLMDCEDNDSMGAMVYDTAREAVRQVNGLLSKLDSN